MTNRINQPITFNASGAILHYTSITPIVKILKHGRATELTQESAAIVIEALCAEIDGLHIDIAHLTKTKNRILQNLVAIRHSNDF